MLKKTLTHLSLLAVLLFMIAPAAFADPSVWARVTTTNSCQSVSTTAVTVLAANVHRTKFSIQTTSGAATVYFRNDGTAVAKASTTSILVGGASYGEEAGSVDTKAISAITASGTAWVCAKESVTP